jgi:carbonic anhydrase
LTTQRHQSLLFLAALAVVSGVALAFASTDKAVTQDARSTPKAAIKALMDGNARYIKDMATSQNRPSDRPALLTTHEPIAGILRCSDARVSPEIYFDQPLGALFVTAVAGNIITPEVIASFEYTVAVLGTKLIIVMGHRKCGAVETAIKMRNKTDQLPGSLPMLIDQIIVPCALDTNPDDVAGHEHEAVICNANKGVGQLLARSPVLAAAVAKGDLKIIAGVQDLATGEFTVTSP